MIRQGYFLLPYLRPLMSLSAKHLLYQGFPGRYFSFSTDSRTIQRSFTRPVKEFPRSGCHYRQPVLRIRPAPGFPLSWLRKAVCRYHQLHRFGVFSLQGRPCSTQSTTSCPWWTWWSCGTAPAGSSAFSRQSYSGGHHQRRGWDQ